LKLNHGNLAVTDPASGERGSKHWAFQKIHGQFQIFSIFKNLTVSLKDFFQILRWQTPLAPAASAPVLDDIHDCFRDQIDVAKLLLLRDKPKFQM
jgi:hypothetical protein